MNKPGKTCARCKESYFKLSSSNLVVSKQFGVYGHRELDLCPKCTKKLELFMNGGSVYAVNVDLGV